jgi:hypothetical protein
LVRSCLGPGHGHNGEQCPSVAWYFHIYIGPITVWPGKFQSKLLQ